MAAAACICSLQDTEELEVVVCGSCCEHPYLPKSAAEAVSLCRYEKVSKHHSWDANWLFTSSCLFQLQRHADHHLHAAKPYQVSTGCQTLLPVPWSVVPG